MTSEKNPTDFSGGCVNDKIDRNISLCQYCYCMTWDISKDGKIVCGKCGELKSNVDFSRGSVKLNE